MRMSKGRVSELLLDATGERGARVACPEGAVPEPGRYLLAWSPDDKDASLAAPIFPTEIADHEFLAGSPIPQSWEPGTELSLRGPLGRGFNVPADSRHLFLAALGGTVSRLLTLIKQSLERNVAVALFTDSPLPNIPTALEVHPLIELADSLSWADFIGIDLPIDLLDSLTTILGMQPGTTTNCTTQVLVSTSMPCGGVGECGVCSVTGKRQSKLACKDGPVFDLQDLTW